MALATYQHDIFNLAEKVYLGSTEISNINLGSSIYVYAKNLIADSHFTSLSNWAPLHPEFITPDNTFGQPNYTSFKISVSGQTSNIFTRIAVKTENYQACNAGELWRCGINYYINDYTTIDYGVEIAVSFYQADKTTIIGSTLYTPLDTSSNGYRFKSVMFTIPDGATYIRYLYHVKRNGEIWLFMPRLQKLK